MFSFFTELFETSNHSTVHVVFDARSGLKHFFPHYIHVLDDQIIKQLLGAFAVRRPRQPKLKDFIWDANTVLMFLASLPDYDDLPLAWHSVKLCLLILLSTMCRKQVLSLLDLQHVDFDDDCVRFALQGLTKVDSATNYKGSIDLKVLELFPYPLDKRLCPVNCLIKYLNNTKYIRGPDVSSLFISLVPPFKAVSSNTFAGWVKKGLEAAGIDMKQFACHSTCASSSSTAFYQGATISEVLLRAGWKNVSTFMKHYARHLKTVPGVCVVDLCFFGTTKGQKRL